METEFQKHSSAKSRPRYQVFVPSHSGDFYYISRNFTEAYKVTITPFFYIKDGLNVLMNACTLQHCGTAKKPNNDDNGHLQNVAFFFPF